MFTTSNDLNFRWSVLLFDPSDNSFTDGPTLIHGRRSAACTLFNSPLHGNRPVVLSVGRSNKAEILDYTTENEWEESKYSKTRF